MHEARAFTFALLLIVCCIPLSLPNVVVNTDTNDNQTSVLAAIGDDNDYFETQWWSRESTTPSNITDDSIVTGDRIQFSAEFPNSVGDPDSDVVSIEWSATKGFRHNVTGNLVIPYDGYEPFILGMNVSQFAWEKVDNIKQGDNVRLTLYHNNTDTDVVVYWADVDNSTWISNFGITGLDMATAAIHVERASFIAEREGSIMVGIYSYDHQPGYYDLIVDTSDTVSEVVEGNTVMYETWHWGSNVTLALDFTAETLGGSLIETSLSNVTFQNFFSPEVSEVQIVADGVLRYITWEIRDRNVYESHTYEVRVSLDGGVSYQLLATGIGETSYVWNTGGFDNYEVCIVEVRALDSNNLQNSGFSSEFSIGANADFTGLFWYAISSRGNQSYIWGHNNNNVTWQVWIENRNLMAYEIAIDGIVTNSGWTTGEEFIVSADGLDMGQHTFSLTLSIDGANRTNTIYVTVLPNPELTTNQIAVSSLTGSFVLGLLLVSEIGRRRRLK